MEYNQLMEAEEKLIILPAYDYNLPIVLGQSMQRQAIHYCVQTMRLRRPGRRDEEQNHDLLYILLRHISKFRIHSNV